MTDTLIPPTWQSIIYGFHKQRSEDRLSLCEYTTINVQFTVLPAIVQLNIFEYLDVSTLRNVLLVSKTTYAILKAPEHVQPLWKPLCESYWPWLKLRDNNHIEIVDDFNELPNHFSLLDLAITKSHGLDERLFTPLRWSNSRHAFRPSRKTLIKYLNDKNKCTIQYTGDLGVGERSVRADEPLPRPIMRLSTSTTTSKEDNRHNNSNNHEHRRRGAGIKNLLLLRPRNRHSNNNKPSIIHKHSYKPFVAPYAGSLNKLHLTPRLVSYFEATILDDADNEKKVNNNNTSNRSTFMNNSRNSNEAVTESGKRAECVAIGLATSSFDVHQHGMPGWNEHSFGYHGDDGGLYHGSGRMNQEFAKFGVGDVIGCGVDYEKGSIFYTLNKKFIGYAFKLEDSMLRTNLFPVIGMDTHCPIQCNFGNDPTMPFEFDLSQLIKKSMNIVDTKATSSTKKRYKHIYNEY